MKRYYFTFGSWEKFPYKNTYLVVVASNFDDATAAFREKYPDMLFMADCSTFEDALRAQTLGFDLAGTTLCGYTRETAGTQIPCCDLLRKMTEELTIPVIAEGGIWERGQLKEVFTCGIHAAVVGTAITRPRDITRRFVDAIGG